MEERIADYFGIGVILVLVVAVSLAIGFQLVDMLNQLLTSFGRIG